MTQSILPERFPDIDDKIYGGFWRRFGAFWLDALITSPWIIMLTMINNAGRMNVFYTIVPSYIFFFFYYIYCVKRWGGTPGKLVCGLKIINVTGCEVGYKEPLMRYLVDLILGFPMSLAMMLLYLEMTDEQFNSMGFLIRSQWTMDNIASWHKPFYWLHMVWVYSEFIVLLCNKRKRALHDFVASTVVIKKEYAERAKQWYEKGA